MKTLEINLNDFKKVTIELANTREEVSNENQFVILLNALPKSFDPIKVVIEYNKEDLS